MYIVFEGIDGSGKDTQLNKAFAWIGRVNKYAQIWKTREPGRQTAAGKEISVLLRGKGFRDGRHALDLYVADRVQQAPLLREINRHSVILSSRNDLSSYAFQGAQGLSFEEIHAAHDYGRSGIVIPDLTFFMDVPADKIEARFEKRGEAREFFEKVEFQKKAAAKYREAVAKLSGERRIVTIDADRDPDIVFGDVVKTLEETVCFV
jgi:dTMP kinase